MAASPETRGDSTARSRASDPSEPHGLLKQRFHTRTPLLAPSKVAIDFVEAVDQPVIGGNPVASEEAPFTFPLKGTTDW